MSRLRVGVLSYRLPVVGQKRGGVDRVAHDLADGLARRGHDVVVWSFDPRPAGAAYTVRRVPHADFLSTRWGMRLTLGAVGNLLPFRCDLGDRQVLLLMGDSLLVSLTGRPAIRVMNGSALGEALAATNWQRRLMQMFSYTTELAAAFVDRRVIAISHNTCRYNPFVRTVIPLGVDTSQFCPPARDTRTARPSVLSVGTLGGRKRGATLTDWFTRHVRPQHPHCTLDQVVERPGPAAVGVTYHVGIPAADLAHLYRRAWVYASPSTYEGFGLPYLEAMASGTPVVATPNPGSREVLDGGRYGVLAEDDEFPAAVNRLLADTTRRDALSVAGLQRATEWSLTRMVDRYEVALKRVAARRMPTA